MPMIVDPNATPIPTPERVTSTDGYLTAVIDADRAGVLLIVDRSANATEAPLWDVERVDPDGSRWPVRSGTPVWSPGGYGLAYDHESPLGVAVRYEATPITPAGLPASVVVVTVPAPEAPRDVWVKSTDDPTRSMRVHVETWPDLVAEARRDLITIPGNPYPVAVSDVYSAPTSNMVVFAADMVEATALRALLESADVLLFSTRPEYDRADAYAVAGAVTETVIAPGQPARRFSFSIQPVARPDAADQSLRLPGWTCADVLTRFATVAAVEASYATYAAHATDGLA